MEWRDIAKMALPVALAGLWLPTGSLAQNNKDDSGKPANPQPQKIVGCLTGYEDRYTLGAADDTLYLLDGDPDTFKRFNAKMVEVTGTLSESSKETSKHDVLSQQPPMLKVTSLKKIADGCN
jgi:hypothetical protein